MGKRGSRVEGALRNPSYLRVANILGLKNLDSNNDVDAIEDYINRNGDPYQNALDAANQAAEDIRNRGVEDLRNLTIGFNDSINDLNNRFNDRYAAQESRFGGLLNEANDRSSRLQDFIRDQQGSFNSALESQASGFQDALASQAADFDRRYGELNSLFIESQKANQLLQGTIDEQNRIAKNQANAFVPDANPNAVSATAGDDRDELFSTTRKKGTKPLNDLTLLTGVGSQGNPLAGLQIA